jgi:hypothetical protein
MSASRKLRIHLGYGIGHVCLCVENRKEGARSVQGTFRTTDYFLKCFPMLFLKRHKSLSLKAIRTRKPPIIK